MAFKNIDGFSSTIALTIDPDGAGATAAVPITCQFRFMTLTIFTGLFSYATFCSSTWEDVREGLSGGSFTWAGYVATGSVYSAPGSLKGLPAAATATMQFDTAATVVFTPKVASDENSIGAFAESARVVQGRISGAPTITWPTV